MSLYSVKITTIGDSAKEALADGMMIIFSEKAPKDVAEFCFVHNHDELKGEILVGGNVVINEHSYSITAVGSIVNHSLATLGHITLCFDGKEEAQLPGALHLKGKPPEDLQIGSTITFS